MTISRTFLYTALCLSALAAGSAQALNVVNKTKETPYLGFSEGVPSSDRSKPKEFKRLREELLGVKITPKSKIVVDLEPCNLLYVSWYESHYVKKINGNGVTERVYVFELTDKNQQIGSNWTLQIGNDGPILFGSNGARYLPKFYHPFELLPGNLPDNL